MYNRILAVIFFISSSLLLFSQTGNDKHPTEQEVAQRIELLNRRTPINLVYNKDVQAYIDVYTIKRPEHLAKIIGMAELYFPLFEAYLDKMGLPLELKYLAVVESALDPKAKSISGATGLWQFLYSAIRLVDLQVDSYVDERCDPVKSTDAAARYLKYLFENYYDWNLALAAYNGGIGTVNNAISKSGGKRDYWDIRKHITPEMQGYVPAFIAVNYVMNYYKDYGIEPVKPIYDFDNIEIVNLDKSISFAQLSALIQVSVEELRFLNPVYLRDFVPVTSPPIQFIIPKEKAEVYYTKKELLKAENNPPEALLPAFGDTRNRQKVIHTVARGEYFHRIAMNYGCRVEDIQKWNNLKSRNLMAGKQLTIWRRVETNPYFFVCGESE
ncbi:MAG: transglycosylase SLT domain-containing protein [Cytophagaceae bacterium]|jgi:membrane-bound lytic murein transglycosylase D|nr:transglycosylase SLT domain-containing protein [Cytophagaceae bacterium]